MCNFRRFTTFLVIVLGLSLPGLAMSQLEEITVTARKVSESIQDIPLSVQAFNAESISEQQIVNIEDIVKFTPE